MKLSNIVKYLFLILFLGVLLYIPKSPFKRFYNNTVLAEFNQTMMFGGKLLDGDNLNISDGYYVFKTEVFDSPVDGNSLSSCEYKFVATVSSVSGNTSVIYSGDSFESSIYEGMLLWNSTDGTVAIVTDINTTSNTIIVDRPVDTGDYSWGNGDSITTKIRSDDGIISLNVANLDSLDFNSPNMYLEVTMDADGNGTLEETFKPRKQFDASIYVEQAKYAQDSASRYFDHDAGELTMRYSGDDLMLNDDSETLILGDDLDFVLNYDSSDDQFEISDGSNLMAAIKKDGTVGNFLNTGNLTFDQAGIFNESGGSYDFRVEGDSDSNLFFIDASLNRVGIGLGDGSGEGLEVPESLLQVGGIGNRGDITLYGDEVVKGATDWNSLTNINDVYIYDTSLDFDAGAWRQSSTAKASSWYNEELDDSDGSCANFLTPVTGDDRCGSKEFPQRAVLVATDSALYIFDAKDNSGWMRFDSASNASDIALGTGSDFVHALNGKVFTGSNNSGTGDGLVEIKFKEDAAYHYYQNSGRRKYSGNILSRNSADGWLGYDSSFALISGGHPNDVYPNFIDGLEYFAVATDAGTSIVNESNGSVVDISPFSTFKHGKVLISDSGSLYIARKNNNALLVWNVLPDSDVAYWEGDKIYQADSRPALPSGDKVSSIDVINGYQGKNNILVLGMGSFGFSVIYENQEDSYRGAIKNYTTGYVSELQVGDVRGVWSFNGSQGSTISNSSTLADISVNNNDATTADGSDSSMNYVHGVRGTGIEFDGENDYLTVADSDDFEFGTGESFSMGMWYKANIADVANGEGLITKGYHDTTPSYPTYWTEINTDEEFEYTSRDGSGLNEVNLKGEKFIPDAEWHHLVVVRDCEQGESRLYEDGELVDEVSDSCYAVGVNVDDLVLMRQYNRYSEGDIDEIFITAEALKNVEVERMYITGKLALESHDTDGDGVADDSTLQQLTGTSDQANTAIITGSTVYMGTGDGVSVMSLLSDSLIDSYGDSNKSDDSGTSFQSDSIVALSSSGSIDYLNNGSQQNQNYQSTLAIATSTGLWIENSDISVSNALAELTSQNLFRAGLTATESFIVEGGKRLDFMVSNTSSSPEISNEQYSENAFEVNNLGDVSGYAFSQVGTFNALTNASMESDEDSSGVADNWNSNSLSATSISDENNSGSAKYGRYSQFITANASGDYLYQNILTFEDYKDSWITASVWVKGDLSEGEENSIRLAVYDGVQTTTSDVLATGLWQRLWLTHKVDPAATQLSFRVYSSVEGSGSAYVDAAQLQNGRVLTSFVLGYSSLSALSQDLIPASDDSYDLGSTDLTWDALYLGDGEGVYFGVDEDITLASDGADQLTLGDGTNSFLTITSNLDGTANFQQSGQGAIYLRDSNTSINSSLDGQLDINASVVLDLNTPEISLENATGTEFQIADGDSLSFVDSSDNVYLALDDTADNQKLQFGDLSNSVNSEYYSDLNLMGIVDLESLTESSITGVYVYDTTKDFDGGSWRENSNAKASSWFNETLGDSDRGNLRRFPEIAYIVSTGTSSSIKIYNYRDNSLWMEFTSGGTGFSDTTGMVIDPAEIVANNGRVYVGGLSNGFIIIDFVRDQIYQIDDSDSRIFNGNVASRNSQLGYSSWENYTIANSIVNGISVNFVYDNEMVAVATDSGISILNLTNKTDYNIADNATDDYEDVYLCGDGTTFASNSTLDQLEKWFDVNELSDNDTSGTPDFIWDEGSTPALWSATPTINDANSGLVILEDSNLYYGDSATILLAHNDGVSIIYDNTGNESVSAVKYLTTGYVSELQVGDVRGVWSFNGTQGSNISNSSTITDISVNSNDATTADGSDSSMNYVHGVKGTGIELDGEDDYLTVADSADFEFGSGESFSMGMWYKADIADVLDGEGLITKGYHDTTPSYPTYWTEINTDEEFEYTSRDGSGLNEVNLKGEKFIPDAEWHHLVVVRDCEQGESRLYEDGELVDEVSDSCYAVGVNGDSLYLMMQYNRRSEGEIDEVVITGNPLSDLLVERMYLSGKLALESHDTDGDGVADDSTLQQLAGTENDSYSLAVDDSAKTLFVASGNSDSGAVSVLGLESDSIIYEYIEGASIVERDGVTAFDISNLFGVSVSGNYTLSNDNKFNLLIAGDDDAGNLSIWMESKELSVLEVLGQISGNSVTKDLIQSQTLVVGRSELESDINNAQVFRDNVLEVNSSVSSINIGNAVNTSDLDVYGDVTIKGSSVIKEISDINDVYVYDTTLDSDGGAWRNDSRAVASSWYNESLDDSGEGNCDIDSMDRCGIKEFPQVAVLVGSADNFYIFDGETKELWMKFSEGGTGSSNRNMIGLESSEIRSVYALNGVIYLGGKTDVYPIYFKEDKSYKPWTPDVGYAGNISQRNSGLGER